MPDKNKKTTDTESQPLDESFQKSYSPKRDDEISTANVLSALGPDFLAPKGGSTASATNDSSDNTSNNNQDSDKQ